MNPHKSEQNKSVFKEWLEKLQQESWHLELIISGFAIYAIYSIKPVLQELEFFRYEFITESSLVFIVVLFNMILKVGWKLFFINLIIHVIFRGLWIGAIGLRSVSGDIDYQTLQFSSRFNDYLKKKMGSFDDYIESLERFCSTIFSFTFLLFLIFLSVLLFIGFGVFFLSLTESFQTGYQSQTGEALNTSGDLQVVFAFLFIVYLILGILVFLDLIFNGAFKKINDNLFSKIYFLIYRFFSFITLSFLYRPLLYNFLDNNYTRKYFYFSIPYLIILLFHEGAVSNKPNPFLPENDLLIENGFMIDDYYYDDLRLNLLSNTGIKPQNNKKELLPWVTMSFFNVHGNYQEIFFKQTRSTIRNLEQNSELKPIHKKGISFFVSDKNKLFVSPDIQEQNAQWEKDLKSIHEEKRRLKRLMRKDSNLSYQSQIDSLELSSAELTQKIKSKVNEARIDYINRLRKDMVSNISVKVNDADYPLDNCFFYTHPHFGEQGIKCIFSLNSVRQGTHLVKVFKKTVENNEIKVIDSLILPFIKH
jgi:hypothetical protein